MTSAEVLLDALWLDWPLALLCGFELPSFLLHSLKIEYSRLRETQLRSHINATTASRAITTNGGPVYSQHNMSSSLLHYDEGKEVLKFQQRSKSGGASGSTTVKSVVMGRGRESGTNKKSWLLSRKTWLDSWTEHIRQKEIVLGKLRAH